MAIDLVVKPGPAITRAEFLADHPPYSIALDGYVWGEPFLAVKGAGPWRNFNHHEAVDRSCTSATCEQARRAVLLGLYDLFSDARGRRATLWVNDCDQDVCLATWILMNPDRAGEPLVRTLAQIENLLDMSSGGFPMPHDRDLLGEVRWIFAPYGEARPRLAGMNAADMGEVISDVHDRIEKFLAGKAGRVPLEGTWTMLGGGDGWVLAEVDKQQAREKMIAAGVRAAVELYGRPAEGRYQYSLWRRSEYIVWFPIREICDELNRAEGIGDPRAGWGGAENVGGSPRGAGSKLPPEEVERVVTGVVQRRRRA
jgi:hypothetical protein